MEKPPQRIHFGLSQTFSQATQWLLFPSPAEPNDSFIFFGHMMQRSASAITGPKRRVASHKQTKKKYLRVGTIRGFRHTRRAREASAARDPCDTRDPRLASRVCCCKCPNERTDKMLAVSMAKRVEKEEEDEGYVFSSSTVTRKKSFRKINEEKKRVWWREIDK